MSNIEYNGKVLLRGRRGCVIVRTAPLPKTSGTPGTVGTPGTLGLLPLPGCHMCAFRPWLCCAIATLFASLSNLFAFESLRFRIYLIVLLGFEVTNPTRRLGRRILGSIPPVGKFARDLSAK